MLRTTLLRSRLALGSRTVLPRLAVRTLADAPPPPPATPTDQVVKPLVRGVSEVSGETLFLLSQLPGGHLSASRERLIREVMAKDEIDRGDAMERVRGIATKNAEGLFLGLLPYRVGITAAIVSGWLSIPAVFSTTFARWFNDMFVTTEVPEICDLETTLEVGMWTWNWMEPPLGTVSFFLLCLQYARDQRINIGQKPWTERYKSQQADKLAPPRGSQSVAGAASPSLAAPEAAHALPRSPPPRNVETPAPVLTIHSVDAVLYVRRFHSSMPPPHSPAPHSSQAAAYPQYDRPIVRDYAKEDDSDDF